MGLPVAIIGSGNIGTDLMYKIERSPSLDLVALIGIDPDSDGLARARDRGYEAPHNGIDWVSENPDAVRDGVRRDERLRPRAAREGPRSRSASAPSTSRPRRADRR